MQHTPHAPVFFFVNFLHVFVIVTFCEGRAVCSDKIGWYRKASLGGRERKTDRQTESVQRGAGGGRRKTNPTASKIIESNLSHHIVAVFIIPTLLLCLGGAYYFCVLAVVVVVVIVLTCV